MAEAAPPLYEDDSPVNEPDSMPLAPPEYDPGRQPAFNFGNFTDAELLTFGRLMNRVYLSEQSSPTYEIGVDASFSSLMNRYDLDLNAFAGTDPERAEALMGTADGEDDPELAHVAIELAKGLVEAGREGSAFNVLIDLAHGDRFAGASGSDATEHADDVLRGLARQEGLLSAEQRELFGEYVRKHDGR